ncbi:MAG: pilus assembly protein PilM [Kiritimatiellae bacterium]|nr:pilus assembly protein PilM [Kiritimatiellia bacterium]
MSVTPRHKAILGLDIGRHSVKAVRALRRGAGALITRADLLRLPADVPDKVEVIGRWLRELAPPGTPCVIGLSAQAAMFQPIELMRDDPRSYAQAAAMEMSRFNELASEPMVYGFTPVSAEDQAKRLLLCMARPSVLEEGLAAPRALAMRVTDVIPFPVALFNLARATGSLEAAPWLYADIGCTGTEVVVGNSAGLRFAGSLACGGQLFSDRLAEAAGVSPAQAEHVKTAEGALNRGDAQHRAALTAAADTWVSEMQTFLSVYRTSFGAEADQPTRLVLSGGGADLTGLREYVADRLHMQVQPVQNLACKTELNNPGRYALAAGLALAGLGLGSADVSLLPLREREELALRRQRRYWIGAAAAAVLILGVSLVGGYRDFQRMETHLKAQRATLNHCQTLAQEIEQIKAQNELTHTMMQPVGDLVRNGPLMRELIDFLNHAKGPQDWITLVSDEASYFRTEAQPAGRKPPVVQRIHSRLPSAPKTAADEPPPEARPAFGRIIVEGYTPKDDLSTVKELIGKLEKAPFVTSADLLPDDQLSGRTGEPRKSLPGGERPFVIDVKVAQP